ncbi:hypothetical protein L486_06825 [Kwoniella mangroviensis CBS 10435]|uniref:CRAL-TRIO domain-containing protein n=1 Tax=Kwoniella mangroviensis CBS 10435 TaxID=1331196 RepID=A0A1B9IIH8_9TREE|nr:hypothetical protein L486_06825 [Kwoniella mangroviensis CBS 10435]
MATWTTLLTPPPDVSPEVKPPLTTDQEAKLNSLIDHFGAPGFTLPIKQHAEEKTGLGDREMMFLSKETLVRFLVATKNDLPATIARLGDCLLWRRTEDIDNLQRMSEECSEESKTGKNLALGFSKKGQPIITFFVNCSFVSLDNPKAVEGFTGRAHPMVYMLERAKDLMCAGVTHTFVVFNWSGKKSGPSLPLSVIKSTNHILSNYYPETLGLSVFQNMPWVFKTLINLVWPFVDPITKKKVKFGTIEGQEIVKEGDVDPSQLLKDAGGSVDIPYDHATYWPAVLQTCLKFRAEEEERWRALGERQVGREEKLFKRPIPSSQ